MADKGALTPSWRGERPIGLLPGPWYYTTTARLHAADQSAVISGRKTESTVPVKDATVKLYWRPTGCLCGKTGTDQFGYYEFTGLVAGVDQYQVVMEDKPTGTQYNDQIKSMLTPGV